MTIAVMKLALEALEQVLYPSRQQLRAFFDLSKAIEEAKTCNMGAMCIQFPAAVPREWVGLTRDEMATIVDGHTDLDPCEEFWCNGEGIAETVQARLKELNHG